MKILLILSLVIISYNSAKAEVLSSSVRALSQPVDGLYPNLESLQAEVFTSGTNVEVISSTITPNNQVYIKVKCNDSPCEGKSKWIPYVDDLGYNTIDTLKINFEFDEFGTMSEPTISSLPKYKAWQDLNLSTSIRNYYNNQRNSIQKELRQNIDTMNQEVNGVDCIDPSPLGLAATTKLNASDLFDGEKNPDELRAYLKQHQNGKNHCGLKNEENADAYNNYLTKYKTYIDTASKHFFNESGLLNNSVFFTCMIFQESEFKNIANSSGYLGLGQMGNAAIEDARKKINKEKDTNKNYKNYMQDLDTKNKANCIKYNKNFFMKDIAYKELKNSIKSCPDLGIAASAVYINLIQEEIEEVVNQPISNFDYYDLSAIAYNGGITNLRKILQQGLANRLSIREIIQRAHKTIDNKSKKPFFEKTKAKEIEDYRYSIRNCMEKGNYNPKCGDSNWQKIRRHSLECFNTYKPEGIKLNHKKEAIACPQF